METNNMLVDKKIWDQLVKAFCEVEAEGRSVHYHKLAGVVHIDLFKEYDQKIFSVKKIIAKAQHKSKKAMKEREFEKIN